MGPIMGMGGAPLGLDCVVDCGRSSRKPRRPRVPTGRTTGLYLVVDGAVHSDSGTGVLPTGVLPPLDGYALERQRDRDLATLGGLGSLGELLLQRREIADQRPTRGPVDELAQVRVGGHAATKANVWFGRAARVGLLLPKLQRGRAALPVLAHALACEALALGDLGSVRGEHEARLAVESEPRGQRVGAVDDQVHRGRLRHDAVVVTAVDVEFL